MGITSKEDISTVRKELQDSRRLAYAPKTIQFAHQFTVGATSVSLLSLTTPSIYSAAGFVNATPQEIASANLSVFAKNLRLSLSRGLELKPYIHYLVQNNTIVFVGALRDSGGALADEILFGEIQAVSTSPYVVGDVRFERGTVEVAVGQTTVNIPVPFKYNANSSDIIGDVKLKRNGRAIYRNVGNAAAGPLADGDYQEVSLGNGYSTQIILNVTPLGQPDLIEWEVGVKLSSGDLSVWGAIEKIQGQVLAIAQDAAEGFHGDTDYTRYLTVAPSDLERRVFGDLVTQLKNDLTGPGTIRQIAFSERKDNTSYSSGQSIGNTLPVITSGDLIFDVNFTPKKTGNKLLIQVQVHGVETSNLSDEFNASLFVNNGTNAVTSGSSSIPQQAGAINSNMQEGTAHFVTEVTATGAMNFKVRAGWNGGSNWILNAHQTFGGTAASLGGTMNSFIKITEVEV